MCDGTARTRAVRALLAREEQRGVRDLAHSPHALEHDVLRDASGRHWAQAGGENGHGARGACLCLDLLPLVVRPTVGLLWRTRTSAVRARGYAQVPPCGTLRSSALMGVSMVPAHTELTRMRYLRRAAVSAPLSRERARRSGTLGKIERTVAGHLHDGGLGGGVGGAVRLGEEGRDRPLPAPRMTPPAACRSSAGR
jgi:hypothetical protein